MILLDTDICIELLRGNKKIMERRNEYDAGTGISFMTVAELYYGAESSSRKAENTSLIQQFFLTVTVIHTDYDILRRFGILKAALKKESTLLPDADLLIAATALSKAEMLITGNMKHFKRIPGLVIENWTS
ncbi:MAG TPA: PIN domain-containing protein [Thermodesulfobacteriota bacterium]|nr:PIN domain-containing protein [Thermodesulfobacteriota bacterium]